jgi:hypothetical protein
MQSPLFGWVSLGLWGLWCLGLQGLFARQPEWGPWTPEVSLVLLLSLAPRLEVGTARIAALLLALLRGAVSADPFPATALVFLLALEFERLLRRTLEAEGLVARMLLSGAMAFALGAFLRLVERVRTPLGGLSAEWSIEAAMPLAVGTGVLAGLAGPGLRRLPGLVGLQRERFA